MHSKEIEGTMYATIIGLFSGYQANGDIVMSPNTVSDCIAQALLDAEGV